MAHLFLVSTILASACFFVFKLRAPMRETFKQTTEQTNKTH